MTTDFDQPSNTTDGSFSNQDQQQQQQQQHIKRPMNPFMVWAQARRKAIAAENPKLHNSDISRLLGEEWRTLPDKEKQHFRDEASRLKSAHRAAHPDYKYKPKSKKRPAASQSDSSDDSQHQTPAQTGSTDAEAADKKASPESPVQQQPAVPAVLAQDQPAEIQLPQPQPPPYFYQLPSYSQVIVVDQNQLNFLLQQQQQQQQQQLQQQYFLSNQQPLPLELQGHTVQQYSAPQQQTQESAIYNQQCDEQFLDSLGLASNFGYLQYQQQQQQQQQEQQAVFYSHATAAADGALMLSQL